MTDSGQLTAESPKGLLNKKSDYKEIKGSLTYNASTAFDMTCYACDEGTFSGGNYAGSGNLSHLGNTSSQTKACVSFIFSGENVIGVKIDNQCCTFIAPNGDKIYTTNDPYELYFNQYGVAEGTCKFYFAGGTGKYQNAEGSFDGKVKNPLNGSFTVDISGSLSY